jgi:hypothetical protein
MTAIALIIGFVMGCGCTVALLFCLKPATERVFISGKVQKRQEKRQESEAVEQPEEALTFEQQMENFLAWDGTPQTGKDVKKND